MTRTLLGISIFCVVILSGCSADEAGLNPDNGSTCQSWEVIACDCLDGSSGFANCLDDGTGFGPCDTCPGSAIDGPGVNLDRETNGDNAPQTTPTTPVNPGNLGSEGSGAGPDQESPLPGDEGDDATEQAYIPDDVNWVEDVKPITDAKCVGCHSPEAKLGSISLAEYEDTQMISPYCGDATVGETMVLKITEPVTCGQIMPPAGYPELSTAEIKVIEDWVLLGMPYGPDEDNGSSDTDSADPTNPENPNTAENDGETNEGPGSGENDNPEDDPATGADGTETADGTDTSDGTDSEEGDETQESDETILEEEDEEIVSFEDVHPIFQKSCSGLACHQYSGFAQSDVNLAYQVVVEKDFADNMVDAILDGRMPASNFGFPLCSGDPSVDTNPKCLTADEQDLVLSWFEDFTNEKIKNEEANSDGTAKAPTWPDAQATFDDVHPILESGCSGGFCHSGGMANFDKEKAYKTVINKGLCDTILQQVQSGEMPAGKGCTGDPLADAVIPGCLNQDDHDILISWITGDESCPE